MRLPQLAPVWALGLTRRRLAALELLRAVMLAAVTALAALPLGLALAAILLTMSSMWRPSDGGCRCSSFPATGWCCCCWPSPPRPLAALVPAWRLARIAPAELLKVFAHER